MVYQRLAAGLTTRDIHWQTTPTTLTLIYSGQFRFNTVYLSMHIFVRWKEAGMPGQTVAREGHRHSTKKSLYGTARGSNSQSFCFETHSNNGATVTLHYTLQLHYITHCIVFGSMDWLWKCIHFVLIFLQNIICFIGNGNRSIKSITFDLSLWTEKKRFTWHCKRAVW